MDGEPPSCTSSSRALVTLAIGREAHEWLKISRPFFEAYAARYDCDLVVIGERRIRCRLQWRKARVNLHLEKFQLGPLLERYERIVYADADVLLAPGCPDLCMLVPPESLGVVADPSGPLAWKRDKEMAEMCKRFGELPGPPPPYFNAGVLVLSSAHRELLRFERSNLLAGRWPEQTALNYYSARWNLPRQYMDLRANFLPGNEDWHDRTARLLAWAVHYAGTDAKAHMAADATMMKD